MHQETTFSSCFYLQVWYKTGIRQETAPSSETIQQQQADFKPTCPDAPDNPESSEEMKTSLAR